MNDAVVKKNDEIEIQIEDIGSEGEGIGKYQGYTLFVKDAVVGDKISCKVMKTTKTYGYAKLLRIITPSPLRVEPRCEHASRCGGCQIQNLSYEQQLAYKQKKVENCLMRIGGLKAPVMQPICGMEDPFYYRNKAQFPVGKTKDGEIAIGFYAGRTHSIIDTDHCYINDEKNLGIVQVIREFLEEFQIEPYDETTHKGLVRHILTRIGHYTGEIMVCMVLNGEHLKYSDVLVERLTKISGMTSICINVNREKTNVILGEKMHLLWGQNYITDTIGGISFHISAQSFYQVNPIQTERLYQIALDYADLSGEETVWDLYCGIGTISLFLSQKAKMVYGVEIVPQAIEDAKENAKRNGIDNVEFFVGAAEDVVPREYEKKKAYAEVIVVDPPRKGCDEKLLQTMITMAPKRIVYVSCDPATLARDVKFLTEHGYEFVKARPVDQFCHSVHVETVCLLSKLNVDKHIEVEINLDEMDLTVSESKATYAEIKDYVLEHTGLKVSNLYIAQVKQKHGIIERVNYNLPKSEDARQPKCPAEKEKAIEEALKFFQMI